MKKINILLIIILFSFRFSALAQITTVCVAEDSIQLKAGNHQIGSLQWEKSQDNINWESIHNANSTSYSFLPTEPAYYRVSNKFAYCDPNYSGVTFVQTKPVANVGGEKIVNGDFTFLSGNTVPNGISQWTILEGNAGVIENPDNPFSKFTGEPGTYKLKYTLQNDCGISSDTLTVRFIENQYYDKLIVVDSTDIISSSEEDITNGIYKIVFSDPVPSIEVGTILLGIVDGGFMRKVQQITQNENVFTMNTIQAKIDEVIQDGGLEMGKLYYLSNDTDNGSGGRGISESLTGFKKLDRMPTRANLLSDQKFKTDNYYYIVEDTIETNLKGISAKSGGSAFEEAHFYYNFDDTEIYNNNGVTAILDGEFRFYPKVKADIETSWLPLEITNAYITLDNARLELDSKLTISLDAEGTTDPYNFTLFSVKKEIIAVIGGMPILMGFNTDFDGNIILSASGNATFELECNHKYVVNAGITYKDGVWNNYFKDEYTPELKNNFTANAEVNAAIDIGPKVTFSIYDIEGPYIDLKLTTDTHLCAATENAETFYWGAGLDLGSKLILGLRPQLPLFEKPLFNISHPWENRKLYTEKLPYSLGYISGDNQQYMAGTTLEFPLKVQVLSKHGRYAPGVLVTFEVMDNSGSLSETEVITNNQGFAEVSFTPSSSGMAHVKAYVKDCDFNYLKYAPVTFSAKEKTDNTAGCSQTTLYASYSIEGNVMKPVAHLGQPPYQYSVNGGNYTDIVPEIPLAEKENYSVAIKDAAGCISYSSYTDLPEYNPDSCLNSNLRIVSLQENGSVVTVTAAGGTAPYLYSKDGMSYISVNTFSNLPNGLTTFYVKDSNGCISDANKEITNGATAPVNGLVAYYPFNGNANDESGNGNHGTVNGATLTIDRFGNAGKAYSFDGVNDYIVTSLQQNNVSSYTISTWVNTSYNSSGAIVNSRAPEGNDFYSNPSRSISLRIGDGKIGCGLNSNFIGIWQTSNSSINANEWVHVTGVFSSMPGINAEPSQFKIYINGILVSSSPTNYNPYNHNIQSPFSGDTVTNIGYWANQVFFNGKLDDIRIYNRALSDSEVQQLYNSEKVVTSPTDGLVAYYPFNGNANDESGNGNNGIVNGATLTTDRFGNAEKAYSFDGVDDFIRVENSNSLQNIGNEITISAWVFANQYSITSNEYIPILEKNNSQQENMQFYLGYDKTVSKLYSGNNGKTHLADCPLITLNNWHHIVVVYNSNSALFYLNGVEYNSTQTYNTNPNNNLPLIIGQNPAGLNEILNGKLDNIRIYNRALSNSEVQQLYYSE